MSKLILSSIAGAVLTIAVPALAASHDGVTNDATTSGPAQAKPTQRYCVMSETTETRIQRKVCKTRQEWLAEGFDPLGK